MAFQAPSLFLPIDQLAEARGIEAAKLQKGLGLTSMSVCDVDEDVITLAAGAALQLLAQNPRLQPSQIGRIYIGTESSIDGSKPIGSYVHEILNQHFSKTNSAQNPLIHTDVIDMTFACIGAIDAMHNSLYYVKAHPESYAIVIATDIADYDLGSTGEYTQGAGAVAVLISSNPRLLAIDDRWGVAMKSEHDFFKPIRLKQDGDETITLHDDKPIFDGQFSNETYQNRIKEAWGHFKKDEQLSAYEQIIFHLPYAYHGRRIIASLLIDDLAQSEELKTICEESEIDLEAKGGVRAFSKTSFYTKWVLDRIAAGERLSSEMGNLYTASIFLSLMSALESPETKDGQSYLFFAYGSGSKSKVFQGKVQKESAEVISKWNIYEQIGSRKQIDFERYIALRTAQLDTPVRQSKEIQRTASGITETNRFERTYRLN